MSEPVRIDQYICIDIDAIIIDEMKEIINSDCVGSHPEDVRNWVELQLAARIVLKNYTVEGCDE